MMKYLSKTKAQQLVRDAVARFPDRMNPMDHDENSCLYTDQGDSTIHCIAGQVLTDAGFPLPEEGDGLVRGERPYGWAIEAGLDSGTSYVEKGYMSKDTLFMLGLIQGEFDTCTHEELPWSAALARCVESGLL